MEHEQFRELGQRFEGLYQDIDDRRASATRPRNLHNQVKDYVDADIAQKMVQVEAKMAGLDYQCNQADQAEQHIKQLAMQTDINTQTDNTSMP